VNEWRFKILEKLLLRVVALLERLVGEERRYYAAPGPARFTPKA
jgi:hypothetical protein